MITAVLLLLLITLCIGAGIWIAEMWFLDDDDQ